MTNSDIKNGIAQRLSEMEPGISIYTDELQEFQKPCFFLFTLNGVQSRETGGRYKRTYAFEIQFIPDGNSSQKRTDCEIMGERLFDQLEFVPYSGSSIRSSDIKFEIMDQVLHFFVNFDVYLIKDKLPSPKMMHLKQEEKLHNV
ncbi:phage tail terminator family protein [Paenibacillus hamazuiensis]|uniref:phage tail terminator family protein n=1 Tax=Paenibacillus hamazuiensis TaxID=2936508 RepID=UPI00200E48A3|nr:hypothetical protein [Paenibacillus hamazuiensis]